MPPTRIPPSALLILVLPVFSAVGQSLGLEFRVNTYTSGHQTRPHVAADLNGNFVVVWQSGLFSDQDGSGWGIFGQRYDREGTPLGGEFRVNTYTPFSQYEPSVARNSAGDFVVVWRSYQDSSNGSIFAQRYGSAGTPLGGEFRVNTYTTSFQYVPMVATASGGAFVVVWQSYSLDGSLSGIFGQRYSGTGSPLGGEFRVNTYTTRQESYPSVASDSNGNFVVVWTFTDNGAGFGLFGQRYDSVGAPNGVEFAVTPVTSYLQRFVAVASTLDGAFVVVWTRMGPDDGSNYAVLGQRFDSAGAPRGGEFRANTYTTFDQAEPSVALDSAGNFVVVWESPQDGSSYGVFGQRYDSMGVPIGTEFGVNTYTTNRQNPASVATSGGHFVVIWRSYWQDGSYSGIFGQRFCTSVPSVTPPPPLTTTQTLCM